MVSDLYVLMITAAVVSLVFKFLKQPVVLGYIVAGVLVGPHLFGETLVNADNVKAWGDIGVLFVLFCIGLEFRLKNLISSGKIAAVGAMTIILGMMLFGYLVGVDAKFDMVNSLFLAGMLCMSSTTIVMKAIDEAGLSKERFVKGATSILIVEDVVAVAQGGHDERGRLRLLGRGALDARGEREADGAGAHGRAKRCVGRGAHAVLRRDGGLRGEGPEPQGDVEAAAARRARDRYDADGEDQIRFRAAGLALRHAGRLGDGGEADLHGEAFVVPADHSAPERSLPAAV